LFLKLYSAKAVHMIGLLPKDPNEYHQTTKNTAEKAQMEMAKE